MPRKIKLILNPISNHGRAGGVADSLSGIVTSIRVTNGVVNLELDTGKTLPMGNVAQIASKAA